MKAACYVRISRDKAGQRAGVDRQRDDCLAECRDRGWDPVLFEDNDRSASKFARKPREQYERMLAAIENGQIAAVVAWSDDRLGRVVRDRLDLYELAEKRSVPIVTVMSGEVDLGTADGEANALHQAIWAAREARKISERTKRAKLQEAKTAQRHRGGPRPYGYHRRSADRFDDAGNVLPCPTCGELDLAGQCGPEADNVRRAAAAILDGDTLYRQARLIGKRPSVLRQILMSPGIAGLRTHHGQLYGPGWEGVLDVATWEKVTELLGSRKRTPFDRTARVGLLTGALVCGRCGERLNSDKGKKRRYTCSAGDLSRGAEPLEDFVRDAIFALLNSDAYGEILAEEQEALETANEIVLELNRYEQRLTNLKTAHFVDGEIARDEYLQMKAELDGRVAALNDKLDAATGYVGAIDIPVGEKLVEWWEHAPIDNRRAVIAMFVERIVVMPVGKGDRSGPTPENVRIEWRAPVSPAA